MRNWDYAPAGALEQDLAQRNDMLRDEVNRLEQSDVRLRNLLARVRARLAEQTAADEDPLLRDIEAALGDNS